MTITAGELLHLNTAFGELMNKDIPSGLAFRLAAYANKISAEMKAAVQQHQKIFNKHSRGKTEIEPEHFLDFIREHEEYTQTSIDIPVLEVTQQELESIPSLSVSQAQILLRITEK